MRYASIRTMDISDGEGVGMALFVQGCHFHCKNCFNQETWDFSKGKEWTKETEKHFMDLVKRPFIERVSFLGGEPLADENVETVLHLLEKVKKIKGKKVWLYSGYTKEVIEKDEKRKRVLDFADVLVDGQYVDALRDLNLDFRGSSNQRILRKGKDF